MIALEGINLSHRFGGVLAVQELDLQVQEGQTLAIMDAMKMEHTIAAPADGLVAELLFAPGDQVTEGAELLRMEVA